MTEDGVSTLVAITNKPREACIIALQLTQGNADMACSILFEGLDMNQMQAMLSRAGGAGMGGMAGMAGGDDYDDYDDGMADAG